MILKIKYIISLILISCFIWSQDCCESEELAIDLCSGIGCYIPQCDEYCAWEPMQCWSSTGYCWCVDQDGHEIEGSSLPSWQGFPDCNEYDIGCFEMDQYSCNQDQSCIWNTDTEFINCSDFNDEEACDEITVCDWHCLGTMWGGQCLGAGYGCDGGINEVDISSCVELDFIPGDQNGDLSVNILDVIEGINLILTNSYSPILDMNSDQELNVIDIIQIIAVIIN